MKVSMLTMTSGVFITLTVGLATFAAAGSFGADAISADWQTYRDSKLGFSISHPADYTVNDAYAYQALGPGNDIRGVSFTIPEHMAKGTNLSSDTRISVEVLRSDTSCAPDQFLSNVQERHSESIGPLRFAVATSNEGAMGNRYEEAVYAISSSSPCLAVGYFIHSTNVGAYDPGTIAPFDRTALGRQFDEIRRTLVIFGLR